MAARSGRVRPVYDYVAGKADWLAADLPFEGTARLAGMLTRRAATVTEGTQVAEALGLLEAQGFGPVLVVNGAGAVTVPPTGTSWRPPPGKLRWGR